YIGRGVFATEPFKKGDFLLQYRGERITGSEGEHREKNYPDEAGNFLYFFKDLQGTYCIDATYSSGLGRIVNDSPRTKANAVMRKIILDNKTYLCLFAAEDIEKGTEIRYDYGTDDLPWRKEGMEDNAIYDRPEIDGEDEEMKEEIDTDSKVDDER
ncbi:unnamed protein product, partial [Porites lobata]